MPSIYAYLLNEGWSEKAIFGLLGNIEQEIHMNPGTWRKLDDTDAAYGLVQWLDAPSLYEKLRDFAKDNIPSIDAQSAKEYEIADIMAEEYPLGKR